MESQDTPDTVGGGVTGEAGVEKKRDRGPEKEVKKDPGVRDRQSRKPRQTSRGNDREAGRTTERYRGRVRRQRMTCTNGREEGGTRQKGTETPRGSGTRKQEPVKETRKGRV